MFKRLVIAWPKLYSTRRYRCGLGSSWLFKPLEQCLVRTQTHAGGGAACILTKSMLHDQAGLQDDCPLATTSITSLALQRITISTCPRMNHVGSSKQGQASVQSAAGSTHVAVPTGGHKMAKAGKQ